MRRLMILNVVLLVAVCTSACFGWGAEPCGNADGKTMYLVNSHPSKSIKVKIRKSWASRARPGLNDDAHVIRPGEAAKKSLGCNKQKIQGGEVRTFKMEIVEASFQSN